MKEKVLKYRGSFLKGAAFAIGLSVTALVAGPLNVFSSGEVLSSSKMNDNFNKLPPVGAIIAWHKSLSGVPTLPDGWVECDGSLVDNLQSPLDGQRTPNLNNAKNAWNQGGAYLRGGTTSSNTLQDDTLQGFRMNFNQVMKVSNVTGHIQVSGGGTAPTTYWPNDFTAFPADDGTNGTPRTASETRPVSMKVVWIMRIY